MSNTPKKFRAARTTLAATLAVLVTFGFAPAAGAQSDPDDLGDGLVAAWNGHSWLADQLSAGTPLELFGSANWGVTFDAGIAVAAVDSAFGTTNPQLSPLWNAFVANRDTAVQVGAIDDPGLLSKAILLAVAMGEDPRAVGASPGADLVARLVALEQTAGSDAGLFGSAFPVYDGTFRQSLSLRALAAVGVTPSAGAVAWLLNQQCSDGAWMPYRGDLGVPCAYDSAAFVGPDSNSTGAAFQALQELNVPTVPTDWSDGTRWLLDNRNSDGGWGFFPDFPSDPSQSADPSDPNSTASALQALVSASDRSPYPGGAAVLTGFQIDCSSSVDPGSFEVSFAPGSGDLLATTQAVAVLALHGNSTVGDTPAADAGLGTPAAPCVSPVASEPTNSTTSSTTTSAAPAPAPPASAPEAPSDSATPTDSTPPDSTPESTGTPSSGDGSTSTGGTSPTAGTSNGTPAQLAYTGGGTSWAPLGWTLLALGILLVAFSRPAVRAVVIHRNREADRD